ncbi:hypothetical protein LEMLEM_LOCUS26198 [Lemmus lemmus]
MLDAVGRGRSSAGGDSFVTYLLPRGSFLYPTVFPGACRNRGSESEASRGWAEPILAWMQTEEPMAFQPGWGRRSRSVPDIPRCCPYLWDTEGSI